MITSGVTQLDVIVGELALLDGHRQSEVAHMALLTPPRRARGDRRTETVLVFLDLGGGTSAGLAHAMVENFNRAYWRCSGTATSALRQAFDAANAHLRDENRLIPISHRRRAGLVCAVLRDDLVFLAQIAPAKALVLKDDQITQFPRELTDRLPMGVSSGLDIQFSHSYLHPGDRLLLTGESWTAEIPDDTLENTLRAGGIENVMLALERRAGHNPFSALIVECAPLPETSDAPRPGRQESLAPAAQATTGSRTDLELEQPQISSTVPERVTQKAVIDSPPPRARRRPSKPIIDFSFDRTRFDESRESLRRMGATISDGTRAMLTRVLPEPEEALPRRRRRTAMAARENITMMAGIAIAIPLLVAFVVVTFYLQRSSTEEREALKKQALNAGQLARQADGEDAHERWDAALQAAQEALLVAPDDQDISQLHAEARAKLDDMDGVWRTDMTSLWNYGSGQGRRLAASRMQVFVLDPDQDQVTQHTLNQALQSTTGDQLTLVAYRGESVGDEVIGELRDVTWLKAGGARAGDMLLITTGDNRLLQHSLSWGLSWVPFESRLNPENVRAVRPYDGKLYILDPQQSQVWRFPSTADAFGPPVSYFSASPPDLSNAVDMAIDGAVYVLMGDGQIHKFLGGEIQPFQLTGLPQPLVRPIALVSEGDLRNGALYVADAGAQAIVALTKSGEFIYQIQANDDALASLDAVTIEEENRTLYVLAAGQLYALALPPVPELSSQE